MDLTPPAGRIRRLSPELANQIAAGEVVERPASVIKELIENAIDARATRLTVTTELGGKKLIRVEDNGEGMIAEDAQLAVERHATSKISSADDLERIATLGFRGEALPSIASVSHFTMRTRARGSEAGTELRLSGGTGLTVTTAGMPEGTSIEVVDLFYNLPARRKFLKSDGAESAQVSKIVTQLALCYPEVGFTLTASGRRVLQWPPVASLGDRLYQIYGERPDLVELRRESGDVSIRGYIAALAEQGPTRGAQNVFVNRRVVKDRTIAHAIIDAYSVASIKERSPEVHLFIDMPREAVDVNVHPTKAEVRFRDQSYMHQIIRRAVADALGRGPAPAFALSPASPPAGIPETLPLPASYEAVFPNRWTPQRHAGADAGTQAVPAAGGERPSSAFASPVAPVAPGPPQDAVPIRPMLALGQFRDTFIIAVDEDGIVIVDQHVAHERVLFERISERLLAGTLESQRLLEPVLVELSAGSRDALRLHAADLARLGFEVEEFGGTAVRVLAYPALLRRGECETALRALAEDLDGFRSDAAVGEAVRRIAATMACHAAVKANDPLTADKMAHILEELRRTSYSTICPHGRPVMLRLSRREVEKNFQRI